MVRPFKSCCAYCTSNSFRNTKNNFRVEATLINVKKSITILEYLVRFLDESEHI